MAKRKAVPLTKRERAQIKEQRRLLSEHIRLTQNAEYRRQVDRARALALNRQSRVRRPLQGDLEASAVLFEQSLRAHYDRLIEQSVRQFREQMIGRRVSKPRAMSAREFRSKLTAWANRTEAASELGLDRRTLDTWARKGVPAKQAIEVRAEHTRKVELNKLQSEYLAAGAQLLREGRKVGPREWPGKSHYESFRRVGARWYRQYDAQLLTPQKVRAFARALKKMQGPGELWQGTVRIAALFPAELVEEVKYGTAGGAYGRMLDAGDLVLLGLGGMTDIPIQTMASSREETIDSLESSLLEAIDEYGTVLLDDLTLYSFELKKQRK